MINYSVICYCLFLDSCQQNAILGYNVIISLIGFYQEVVSIYA